MTKETPVKRADTPPGPSVAHLLAHAQKKGLTGPRTTTWNEMVQAWNGASDEERDQVIAEALKRKRS